MKGLEGLDSKGRKEQAAARESVKLVERAIKKAITKHGTRWKSGEDNTLYYPYEDLIGFVRMESYKGPILVSESIVYASLKMLCGRHPDAPFDLGQHPAAGKVVWVKARRSTSKAGQP